ncbi:hypothetical protein [Brachyspira sp. G79]|uniref:hypothetical protein n=1 Tax=Brachyspira sp. G79 TaxID=1358104 RepID=UPI001177AEB7|nr:hypothetical protein [Brachyspira sp. G79]
MMTKKIFLFTLLVSSFLVISCGNDSTNPETEKPIGTGIDTKYVGTYENNAAEGKNGTMQVIYEVTTDGGINTTINYYSNGQTYTGALLAKEIDKYSDTKYKSSFGAGETFEFSADGSSLTITSPSISDNPIVLTKK